MTFSDFPQNFSVATGLDRLCRTVSERWRGSNPLPHRAFLRVLGGSVAEPPFDRPGTLCQLPLL